MMLSITRRPCSALPALLTLLTSLTAPLPATAEQPVTPCKLDGSVARVAELPEGSGVAASRRTQGRFWSHNDSGEPVLVALDDRGRVAGRLQLSGAEVEDWEAVAVAPCREGSCIYVADIGDNDAQRDQITIYRVAEPSSPGGSAKVLHVIRAAYPDGPHDAEALLVAPDGRLYIVTKGDTGPVALYRFPADPGAGTVRLERVGGPREGGRSGENDKITDGAVSPDGQWIVLRSKTALMFYKAADLLSGDWREAGRFVLSPLGEPQGEGVTFGSGNALYLVSEGGGKKQPGVFTRLTCTLNP